MGILNFKLVFSAPLDTMCSLSPSSSSMESYQVGEFNEFEVNCRVDYTGNWSPAILCDLPFKHDIALTSSYISKSVSMTQRITALGSMSNTTIECTTTFKKDGLHFINVTSEYISQKHANNVPDFIVKWTSPTLHIVCEYVYYSMCFENLNIFRFIQ